MTVRLQTSDGIAIEVAEFPGTGPWTVLAVHDVATVGGAGPAQGSGSAALQPMALLLRPLGRTVLPDLRGHGRSGGTSGSLQTLADDLDEIRAGAGLGRPVLLGHGSGGAVATRASIDQPWAWRALILVAPTGRLPAADDADLPALVVATAGESAGESAALPGSRHAVIEGPAGVPWLDAPERFLQVLGGFLETVDPGSGMTGIAPGADPR